MFLSRVVIQKIVAKHAYSHHQFLWQLFPNTPKDSFRFLFKHIPQFHPFGFMVLSEKEPTPCPDFDIQTKPYHPKLTVGNVLEFSVTVNPVITKKGKRSDIVMDWRFHHDRKSKPLAEVVSEEGKKWLETRSQKYGFELIRVTADGYQQHQFYKTKETKIKISTLDFAGILKVTDPECFKEILFKGLGPAKGFGCGLVLVKRTYE